MKNEKRKTKCWYAGCWWYRNLIGKISHTKKMLAIQYNFFFFHTWILYWFSLSVEGFLKIWFSVLSDVKSFSKGKYDKVPEVSFVHSNNNAWMHPSLCMTWVGLMSCNKFKIFCIQVLWTGNPPWKWIFGIWFFVI